MSCVDSTWRDKSWARQALMHLKLNIPDSWWTGWKAKACKSFALYLKKQRLAKALLCTWRYSRTIYIIFGMYECYPLNHVYIRSFRSIIEATEKFPWGGGIWSPGMDLWWGIWTAFRPREGEFQQNFSNIQMPEGCAGGCLSFDLTGT